MNNTGQYIQSREQLLSIYFTAEYPNADDTQQVLLALQEAGADLIEVGIPFSDPLADGPVIQQSGEKALRNGFTLQGLFRDLKVVRQKVTIPLVPMGYFNTVLAYGVEPFLAKCQSIEIDTLILPDLPIDIYEKEYQSLFEQYNVAPVFLITPQTSDDRIHQIDALSEAFIYVVADNSITGGSSGFSDAQLAYFSRIQKMELATPLMIGFGISSHQSFIDACNYASGAIIGSAYIRAIADAQSLTEATTQFIHSIRKENT